MPTTWAQTQEYLETRLSNLETHMGSINDTIQVEVKTSLHVEVQVVVRDTLKPFTKGKQADPNTKDPHHSHYEHTHSSHSPWGSPHSWNKVPKFDMHKFDGSNLGGWVSQMEQYFSLHNIWDDETKIHVGILYLDQEWWQW